uniref:Helicase C-terminal domain-containing protein n=1 Tax=Angiostrongylus cantonensis TaxID=6313 RepID=A0A0K0CWP8_ANGCA
AEDRAHRVGQKDSVFVQYLVARNTADDVIWPLVQRKLDVLGQTRTLRYLAAVMFCRFTFDCDHTQLSVDSVYNPIVYIE